MNQEKKIWREARENKIFYTHYSLTTEAPTNGFKWENNEVRALAPKKKKKIVGEAKHFYPFTLCMYNAIYLLTCNRQARREKKGKIGKHHLSERVKSNGVW